MGAAVTQTDTNSWLPSYRQIQQLEKQIVLPEGAKSGLPYYERTYTGVFESGASIIIGSMCRISGGLGQAEAVPGKMLPSVSDAGCDFLTVRYNPASRAKPKVSCSARLMPPERKRPRRISSLRMNNLPNP